jgi:fluoride exporter
MSHPDEQVSPSLAESRRCSVGMECFETAEQPPEECISPRPPKPSNPLSLDVIVLLIPSSILGALTRLGLIALGNYDGASIFPLMYVQAIGCLIMGFAVGLKEPFGHLYVTIS